MSISLMYGDFGDMLCYVVGSSIVRVAYISHITENFCVSTNSLFIRDMGS